MNGYDANGKIFRVHLDGYDQHELLSGGDHKRREFFYCTDDGDLAGLRYTESGEWEKWYVERMFLMAPAQAIVGKEIQSLKEFPPQQKPGHFSVGDARDAPERRAE